MANLDEMLALLRSHNEGCAAIVAESVVRILKVAIETERAECSRLCDDIGTGLTGEKAQLAHELAMRIRMRGVKGAN